MDALDLTCSTLQTDILRQKLLQFTSPEDIKKMKDYQTLGSFRQRKSVRWYFKHLQDM